MPDRIFLGEEGPDWLSLLSLSLRKGWFIVSNTARICRSHYSLGRTRISAVTREGRRFAFLKRRRPSRERRLIGKRDACVHRSHKRSFNHAAAFALRSVPFCSALVCTRGVFTDTIIIAIDDEGHHHRRRQRRRTSSQTAEQILGTESSSITLLLRCKWPGRATSLR